jgi:hypothetical protein
MVATFTRASPELQSIIALDETLRRPSSRTGACDFASIQPETSQRLHRSLNFANVKNNV